jgi:hypothetical protein
MGKVVLCETRGLNIMRVSTQVWSGLVAGVLVMGLPGEVNAQTTQVIEGELTEQSQRREINGTYFNVHR